MEMDLEMHFEIKKQPEVPSGLLLLVLRVLTAALESSIVIVEGVTLALIDKGGKKSFLRACFHLYDSGYTHAVITASRQNLWAFAAHVCVCKGMYRSSLWSSTGLTCTAVLGLEEGEKSVDSLHFIISARVFLG